MFRVLARAGRESAVGLQSNADNGRPHANVHGNFNED